MPEADVELGGGGHASTAVKGPRGGDSKEAGPRSSSSSSTPGNAGRRDPRFGYESIADHRDGGVKILGIAASVDTEAANIGPTSDSTRRRAHSPHLSSSSASRNSGHEARNSLNMPSSARTIDDDSTFRKIRALRMNLDEVMASVFDSLGFQRVGNCFVRPRRAETGQNTGADWVVGPHYAGVIFTLFLTLFITFLLFRLVHKSEHLNQDWNNLALTVISCATAITFMNVVLKDPGVVRTTPVGSSSNISTMPYCDMCEIYQAPRTAHCPHCDVCIAGMDHHCPWIGKCIGKGNMRQFAWFNACWISYFFYFIFLIAKA